MQPPRHRSLEYRSNQPDEAQQLARLRRPVAKKIVGHEGKRKLHAGEKQDKNKMRKVDQQMRIRPTPLAHLPLPLPTSHMPIRLPIHTFLPNHRPRLRQIQPQIKRLDQNQAQRKPRRRRKRIRRHRTNIRQRRPQRRPERKRNTKARTHQRHRRPTLPLIANIRRHGRRQLNIALTQPPHDPTGQKGAEVDGGDPQGDGGDVADHGPEQGGAAAVPVGEAPDDGGGDRL